MELKISNDVKITSDDFNYIINILEKGEYVEKLFFSKWKHLHVAVNAMKITGRGKKGGLEKFNTVSDKMNEVIAKIYNETLHLNEVNMEVMNYTIIGGFGDVVVSESREEWSNPHTLGYYSSISYALCCILEYEVRRSNEDDLVKYVEYVTKELLKGVK